ncbi:bifunctional DNA primase/polymerase [Pseudonocardia sp. K10HN5]|uniref:Bifunctional DNA primase/polymerase n=2 Tax=Pseudonocardia acidicola TaxID=2724939 RepID=A0ABX1S4U9_9PSEU|nr:bifunctional DNA primase/polymerase [Pseudonocardia acidicola]
MEEQKSGGRRLLHRALAAAIEQQFYVLPVVPRGKTPAIKSWEDAATRDPQQIRAWFDQRPYNIGIAVGRSGLIVVDLDEAHGEPAPPAWAGARNGRDVLARLAHAAGKSVPDHTYTIQTPTGGIHLYFRQPPGTVFRNTGGTLGWRIDTRASGGYVVAAGSVRREGYYRVINRAPIAPLPAWLADALAPPPPPPPVAPIELPRGRAGAYVRAVVEGECRAVTEAATGTRHRTLLRAARILGELVGGGVLDESAARAALNQAAARHIGVDHCTAHDIARTVADGLAYGRRRPRQIGPSCT